MNPNPQTLGSAVEAQGGAAPLLPCTKPCISLPSATPLGAREGVSPFHIQLGPPRICMLKTKIGGAVPAQGRKFWVIKVHSLYLIKPFHGSLSQLARTSNCSLTKEESLEKLTKALNKMITEKPPANSTVNILKNISVQHTNLLSLIQQFPSIVTTLSKTDI